MIEEAGLKNHKPKPFSLKNSGGFTLVELLASMVIFAVITAAVVANLRVGQRSNELRLAAAELASALHRARTMAQTGRAVDLCDADSGAFAGFVWQSGNTCKHSLRVPPGGFGIRLDGDQTAFFFADAIPDASGNMDRSYKEGERLFSEAVNFPGVIVIEDISLTSEPALAAQSVENIDIVFEPPAADIWIDGSQDAQEARITLGHRRSDQTRTVVIRRLSGRIEVE